MSGENGLPQGWVQVTLEQVTEVHDNLREPVNAKERAKRHGPYPYYGATGQVGWIDDFRQDGEYVLLGEDGAPFLDPAKPTAYMVSGQCWVNNHAHVLKGVSGLCSNRFMMHALNQVNYRNFVSGTTRLKLTQGAMRRLPLLLSPEPEQHRIVAKIEELFSKLDAGVAALERVKANLKRYRASVLKAAVEGKLTEQWRKDNPDVEPASVLLKRILTERREKWEEDQLRKFEEKGKTPTKKWKDKYKEPVEADTSGLPELPDGWCWITAEQMTAPERTIRYGIIKPGPDTPGGIPYVRVMEMKTGSIDVSSLKRCHPGREAKFSNARLACGDLLISKDGTIGRVAIVPPELEGGNITQHVRNLSTTLRHERSCD